MARIGEQFGLGPDFDDPPEIHDRHPVRHVLHHRQVVGDEQIRQPEPRLQIGQQIHHLRLDRHIERADRLVQHHQRRFERQRPGDADPLPLTAGKFVRVAGRVIRREADQLQQLRHPGTPGGRIADPVHHQRLGEDVVHAHARIERGERVLEHHLHPPPHRPQRRPTEAGDVRALEPDNPARRLDQAERQPRRGALAAAAFADQRKGLTRGHAERHTIHSTHRRWCAGERPGTGGEVLGEAAYLQNIRQ